MNLLVGTNVLLRTLQPGHPQQHPAGGAVVALRAAGHVLCVVPQVLYELWVVMTRPAAVNGPDRTPAEADAELTMILTDVPLLLDSPDVSDHWRALVAAHAVIGKKAHDARLVAAMQVHAVTHLLTFDGADVARPRSRPSTRQSSPPRRRRDYRTPAPGRGANVRAAEFRQ